MTEDSKLYWKYLPLAYEIYHDLYGKPETHADYANGFNIRGVIVRSLIKSKEKI